MDTHRSKTTIVALCVLLTTGLTVLPASAQVDLSGQWGNRAHEDQPARGGGLEIGEYTGYPLNAAGRAAAASWDAAIGANPERQCVPLGIMTANTNLRIMREIDPTSQQDIAWHIHLDWQSQDRTIWMDGRPHPPEDAPHTWQGFSTGKWVGNQLVVTTTHLKKSVIERNGIPRSDSATTVEHFMRYGDILTVTHVVYDPVWLEEPFVQTRSWFLTPNLANNGYECIPHDELLTRSKGSVPHYLPGKNPHLLRANIRYGLPEIALRGGADTMYPEFQLKLKDATAARAAEERPRPRTVDWSIGVRPAEREKGKVSVLPVQGNVYMISGEGGNTTVQVGESSVIVVDTQTGSLADQIVAAIRQITKKPIRYVINTHVHPDHIGGNLTVAKAGHSIGTNGDGFGGNSNVPARNVAGIVAHINVLQRISAPTGATASTPFDAWPSDAYEGADYRLFNGEGVQIIHQPAAHTDGDSIVFFRRSDVISAGDVYSTVTYPVIDRENGGSINGIIAALNHIVDLSIPRNKQEGGTYVVPGHGRISDQADVVEYRDMVTMIRDRIQDGVKRGLTLEQVLAERPTQDFDGRYGAPVESWTKEKFIEAVYRDLAGGKSN